MKTPTATNLSYRPDIDGLRAIAVLSVILYHAGFSSFSGGFVGVDVFFVISGFLITRLLVAEIQKNSKVDFARFYLRRARRLLPAMFFTLIFTTTLSFWYLSPQQLESYGASLLHAVLSISNIYFYSESGYFDTTSSLKPLLHTWSLGVEEQFYMIWPFLLGLIPSRKFLIPGLVISVGLISFYFCQSIITSYPSAAFFLTPFRVFEFSIGAILVWLIKKEFTHKYFKDIALCTGLILIAYSVFFYSEQTVFPGISALVPCIGTGICIYTGDAKYAGRILSNPLFVAIGLISYSLYLVHWPLMVFYKNHFNSGELESVESFLLVAASGIIAVFMYYFIEKPFRKTQATNGRFFLTCALLALSLSYLGASMWATNGWPWRSWASFSNLSGEAITRGKELRFTTRQKICQEKGWDSCDEIIKGKVNALILGDSHAVDALNAFTAIYPEHNFSMSELGGCPPFADIEKITPPTHPDRTKCKKLNLARYAPDYLRKFDYIVINVLFGWYTPEHLHEYLLFLKSSGIKKVIVLGDYFVLNREMYELLNDFGYNEIQVLSEIEETAEIEANLKKYVNEQGFFLLSKRKAFCTLDSCEIFDENGIPFTYDLHHLSYEFAVKMAVKSKKDLDKFLGKLAN